MSVLRDQDRPCIPRYPAAITLQLRLRAQIPELRCFNPDRPGITPFTSTNRNTHEPLGKGWSGSGAEIEPSS